MKKKKNKIFAKQENLWSNVEMLLIKRRELFDQFTKSNIISRGEKIYQRKSEQKSDQLILKWVQVPKDRFDFTKLQINENKDLAAMIDNRRYTINDANELVNVERNDKKC